MSESGYRNVQRPDESGIISQLMTRGGNLWSDVQGGKILGEVGIKMFLFFISFMYSSTVLLRYLAYLFDSPITLNILIAKGLGSFILLCIIPKNFYLPNFHLYRRPISSADTSTDDGTTNDKSDAGANANAAERGYLPMEQFLLGLSHTLIHFFALTTFYIGGFSLPMLVLCGFFWITWTHFRMQTVRQVQEGKRLNKLTVYDGRVYLVAWAAVGIEKLLLTKEILKNLRLAFGASAYVAHATSAGKVTESLNFLDTWFNVAAIAIYAGGILLVAKKMQWKHLSTFVLVVVAHFIFQLLLSAVQFILVNNSNIGLSKRNSIDSIDWLPCRMFVIVFLNSLLRDFVMPLYSSPTTTTSTSTGAIEVDDQKDEKSREDSASSSSPAENAQSSSTSSSTNLLKLMTVACSFVFYYTEEFWWYGVFQLLIIGWFWQDLLTYAKTSTTMPANFIRRWVLPSSTTSSTSSASSISRATGVGLLKSIKMIKSKFSK